ncbi:MAG TPA: hypothetical protein VL995_01215 [Cellvibrio sp.]|nr:hypothetical protein [Cellvibrio sp.]
MSEDVARKIIMLGKLLKSFSEVSKVKINLFLILAFSLHVLLSFIVKDFAWLASFGALLGVIAILLIASQSFLADYETEIYHLHLEKTPNEMVVGGFNFGSHVKDESKIKEILEKRKIEFSKKYKNVIYYLVLTIIGTLIWAYAGFLNKLFFV